MTTYAALTQDIQDWAENDDSEFTSEIDQFIANAESRLFREVPFLDAFKGTDTGTLTASNNSLTLPSGVRVIRSFSITVSSSAVFLQQRLESYLQDYWPNSSTEGQPKFYARSGETTLLLAPTPDDSYAYTIRSRKLPTGLSGSNTTTWLSTNVPELLLAACMADATLFLKNSEKNDRWEATYARGLASLQSEMGYTLSNENTTGA